MRVSREKFAENRDRILDVAARLFREKGYDGIGVADIMKAAGLTHGGFYGHFASKDDLIAQASRRAAQASLPDWQALASGAPEAALAAIVESYLSKAHRDAPGSGCLLAALGPELARQSGEARGAATQALRDQIEVLEKVVAGGVKSERRTAALLTLSTLVGALVLARVGDDEALSDELLAAARAALLEAD